MTRTISDTVTEICALRHGIENAAWEEARGKLMAYLRLRGSCFGGDQEEYDALKYEIENFIKRIDEGDIYQDSTDEITRLRADNKKLRADKAAWQGVQQGTADVVKQLEAKNEKLRAALKPFAELSQHTGSMSDSDGVCVYVEDLHAAAAAIREGGK